MPLRIDKRRGRIQRATGDCGDRSTQLRFVPFRYDARIVQKRSRAHRDQPWGPSRHDFTTIEAVPKVYVVELSELAKGDPNANDVGMRASMRCAVSHHSVWAHPMGDWGSMEGLWRQSVICLSVQGNLACYVAFGKREQGFPSIRLLGGFGTGTGTGTKRIVGYTTLYVGSVPNLGFGTGAFYPRMCMWRSTDVDRPEREPLKRDYTHNPIVKRWAQLLPNEDRESS